VGPGAVRKKNAIQQGVPVLAIPFWGEPVFVFNNSFYAALVAIVDMKIRKEFIILSRNL
jgi:hypothetical protein